MFYLLFYFHNFYPSTHGVGFSFLWRPLSIWIVYIFHYGWISHPNLAIHNYIIPHLNCNRNFFYHNSALDSLPFWLLLTFGAAVVLLEHPTLPLNRSLVSKLSTTASRWATAVRAPSRTGRWSAPTTAQGLLPNTRRTFLPFVPWGKMVALPGLRAR